jgi:hypothetical protein
MNIDDEVRRRVGLDRLTDAEVDKALAKAETAMTRASGPEHEFVPEMAVYNVWSNEFDWRPAHRDKLEREVAAIMADES